MGYNEPDSLELLPTAFVAAGPALHTDFTVAVRAALPSDPVTGPGAATAKAQDRAASAGAPRPAVRHQYVTQRLRLLFC